MMDQLRALLGSVAIDVAKLTLNLLSRPLIYGCTTMRIVIVLPLSIVAARLLPRRAITSTMIGMTIRLRINAARMSPATPSSSIPRETMVVRTREATLGCINQGLLRRSGQQRCNIREA